MRRALVAFLAIASLHCIIARAGSLTTSAITPAGIAATPAGMDVLDLGESPEQAARRMGLPPPVAKKKKGPAAPDRPGYTPEELANSRGTAQPVSPVLPPEADPGASDSWDGHDHGHDKQDDREEKEDRMADAEKHDHKKKHGDN